ncbi:MAG: DUF2333 family protein [Rhodospirillales bacterium]
MGSSTAGTATSSRFRSWRLALGLLVLVVVLYIGAMIWTHQINDDLDFQPAPDQQVSGGSHAVDMAVALINREVVETNWVPNNPFPFPSYFLDNMRNFQLGLFYALSRFGIEMTDSLGRMRGTSAADPDLDKAAGLLKYDGSVWVWEPSISLLPTATAESQYEAAMRALQSYNRRLAAGQADFDRRADNLIAFLERVAADLGSTSALLAERAEAPSLGWFDLQADDDFFNAKGRLYGYYKILEALGQDFDQVIAERNAQALWDNMLESFRVAAGMNPLIVSNGAPDGLVFPNHLAVQGFYLLRGRTQLRELINVLSK